jgi:hypothetical protein
LCLSEEMGSTIILCIPTVCIYRVYKKLTETCGVVFRGRAREYDRQKSKEVSDMNMDGPPDEEPGRTRGHDPSLEWDEGRIEQLSDEQLRVAIKGLQKRSRRGDVSKVDESKFLLEQLDAEVAKRQRVRSDEHAHPMNEPMLEQAYREQVRQLTNRAEVDTFGVLQGPVQRKISTGAGCLIYGALALLLAVLFWSWLFVVTEIFAPSNPQRVWPAIIALVLGGVVIITSYFWVPPLYVMVKRAYLLHFGVKAIAEIVDVRREVVRKSRGGGLSWVQLDWRWQVSNGKSYQNNTVYTIREGEDAQRYAQFVTAYAGGARFPVYFLSRWPHFFVVPAIKARAHTFVSDFFMGGRGPMP